MHRYCLTDSRTAFLMLYHECARSGAVTSIEKVFTRHYPSRKGAFFLLTNTHLVVQLDNNTQDTQINRSRASDRLGSSINA